MGQDQRIVTAQRVELIRLEDGLTLARPAQPRRMAMLAALLRRNLLFLAIVAAPGLACAAYFFLIAADRYQSEVKFVVRSPSSSVSNQLSSLVQGSSIVRSSDDAYIVQSYMLSRDAMDYLVQHADLKAAFDRPEADFLWRYPPLWRSANEERLFKHYKRFVSVEYDHSTGVATLTVQAFRPEDAQRIAIVLVERAEALINRLSERSGQSAIESALGEVKSAEQHAHDALDAVTGFRNQAKVIDPSQASLATFGTIAELSLRVAEANASLSDVEKETPGGPQAINLRRKIDALQDQIAVERRKLAGGADSLAPQVAEYERLLLDQTFAEQTFMSALTALESARVDALKQRVFVESITAANLPDYPAYPYRIIWTLACFAVAFMIWRVVRTAVEDTMNHARD